MQSSCQPLLSVVCLPSAWGMGAEHNTGTVAKIIEAARFVSRVVEY
jgi:hypothetical protein